MCGSVFGFFANLFSNESDYIKAQMDLQQRMAQEKQKMYEDRAKAEMLAMEQKANKIKEDANRLKKKNYAAFAVSGADINSPSYGAFLEGNKKLVKKDVNNARLMGLERAQQAMYGARQAVFEGQAAQIEGQAKLSARRTKLIGQAGAAVGDLFGTAADIKTFMS